MTALTLALWLVVTGHSLSDAARPQQASTEATKAPSAVALEMVVIVEKAITGAAEEMPEDKYEFVPTAGAFRGVRTFLARSSMRRPFSTLSPPPCSGKRSPPTWRTSVVQTAFVPKPRFFSI
jgi:hypothetical protein